MNINPSVSIVIPAYNAQRFLEKTLKSISQQEYNNWECIVVDDGSSDDTASVVEKFCSTEPRFRLVRQSNGGCTRAREAGVLASNPESELLYFLDADDVLEEHCLAVACSYLRDNPVASMVHFDCTTIDESDQRIEDGTADFTPMRHKRLVPFLVGARELMPEEFVTPFVSIYSLAGIIPSLTILRRSSYESSGGWDLTFQQGYEDTDLWLRISLIGEVHYLSKRLVRYRRHEAQHTSPSREVEYGMQYTRLLNKWLFQEQLSDESKNILRKAELFRRTGLPVYNNVSIALSSIRRGDYFRTLKHFYGAARALIGLQGRIR
jgi:glycosyltransferase involved in cell wall biosynthesis